MHTRRTPSAALLRQASATDLMVTRRQLLADGFTDRMIHTRVRDGRWRALGKGVHRLAPDPLAWQHYAIAAALAYGTKAAVGGTVAAYAWRLTEELPDSVVVRVPTARTPVPSGLWLPRTDARDRCSRSVRIREPGLLRAPLRVTSLEDTVFDCLTEAADQDEAVALLARALGGRGWVATALDYWSTQFRQIPYRALLRDILDEANGVRSALEYHYRQDCEKPHGLPVGDLQAAIRKGAIHDVAYRPYRSLVELDGARYHGGEQRLRDKRRDNTSLVQGWVTLRFGWQDVVGEPCESAAQVAEVLRQRGWDGRMRRCPRCP